MSKTKKVKSDSKMKPEQKVDKRKTFLKAMGISGAAFALGNVVSLLVDILIVSVGPFRSIIEAVPEGQPLIKIVLFVIFLILFLFIQGFVVGAIGGLGLSRIDTTRSKKYFIWRSGVAFGVTEGLLVIVFVFISSLLLFYNKDFERELMEVMGLFGMYGLIWGLLSSLILGLLTFQFKLRRLVYIVLAGTIGFAIGGVVAGLLLYLNPIDIDNRDSIRVFIELSVLFIIVYFIAGSALGWVYAWIYNHQDFDKVSKSTHKREKIIVGGILLFSLTVLLVSNIRILFNFLVKNDANFSTELVLNTNGVHWSDEVRIGESGQLDLVQANKEIEGRSVYCNEKQILVYKKEGAETLEFDTYKCIGEPSIGIDSGGSIHIVWYSDEVKDINGVIRNQDVIYETIGNNNKWTEPFILSTIKGEVKLGLAGREDGDLEVRWADSEGVFSIDQNTYSCDVIPENDITLEMIKTIKEGGFHPEDQILPYCGNKYEGMVFMPNPPKTLENEEQTVYGGYSTLDEITSEAEYEVLFATMEYVSDVNHDSPGYSYASSVATLYKKVKENPEDYPRGMSVKILLGNYPEVSDFQWGQQIWNVIEDLKDSGVDKMVDEEIGWDLQVANFEGTWPHSHSKFVVIDGKEVIGGGFNYSYLHLDTEYFPEEGYDMVDLGIHVKGPVAQMSVVAHDELWEGANKVTCDEFYPEIEQLWQMHCVEEKASVYHVPEVTRFLVEDGESPVFSLFRNEKYKEGDNVIAAALAEADETIDIFEVNFSLVMLCDVEIIYGGVCDFNNALPYMESIAQSMKENGTKVRVITEKSNMNGMENSIGIRVLEEELAKYGLEDNLEVRFYNNKMHAKSMVIDNEVVIIGSQNFHYSAWGESGLTEYSIAVEDQKAVEDYNATFEYYWEQSTPVSFLGTEGPALENLESDGT